MNELQEEKKVLEIRIKEALAEITKLKFKITYDKRRLRLVEQQIRETNG